MCKKNNKVSVIIPVYNVERYIAKCIESVLSQQYKDLELILINDGSSDRSLEIIESYAQKDTRVIVITQDNKGVAGARNTGIENSSGTYITFLDADDIWEKEFLEKMIGAIQGADMAICSLYRIHSNGKITNSRLINLYEINTTQWCWPIVYNLSISCCRCIYWRKTIERIHLRFTEGRRTGEDQEFALRYMIRTKKINYSPEAIYYYRDNPGSIMHQSRKWKAHFDAVEAIKSVEDYSYDYLTDERMALIRKKFNYYKYPFILEFAILTALTAGKSPQIVMEFLKSRNYDQILTKAVKSEEHWDSGFMRLWKKNPYLCLQYYYVRKTLGNMKRAIVRGISR